MSECVAAKRAIRNHRGQLLRGVSAVALLAALSSQASAQSMAQLRAVTGIATTAAVANAATQTGQGANATAGMSAAAQRALAYQNQVSQSISLAMQAQSAARAAAQALNPGVPDGLGLGGLQPVANPVPAAQDPTGLNTWEGASAPTQTTSGTNVQVTINQTQSRAILSWDTFNIGANTTLTFNQKQNGVAQPDWVALNRVVGQIDPLTGLRDPNTAPAPSQILGSLKADGTVLVLNQNGILFGGTAQVNVHSLVATSLEIGRALDGITPLTIADRDSEFLNFGLLGFADQASATQLPSAFTFSAQAIDSSNYDPLLEGKIEIDAGANIAADTGGFILLTGPKVTNSGQLTAPQGQVSLQSGREVTLQRSEGAANSINPDVRGFVITALNRNDAAGNYVENDGIIEASEGYVSLASTDSGGVINDGILESTTSVSRNGFIQLSGGDIQLGAGSTISIGPEDSKETIPQDPTSLQDFKPSKVDIGSAQSRIEMQQNAMIYAPSGDVIMGADPGPSTNPDSLAPGTSRIFIDSGATIDVAGLTDVQIAASRNEILIRPVTANDLQDAPDYKNGFLDGAAVYVDPRLSGVRSDGVAWVGSPLIPAESYAEQVGVTVQELMTTGGNVTLGVSSFSPSQTTAPAPDVTIKSGATIDLSGGWVTYQAGMVQTTQLVDAGGEVVDISNADPNDTFIGIYNGFVASQPRWGISQTFENPLFSGTQYEAAYSEGRDAGSLTVKASAVVLDGTVYANAYPGPLQLINAHPGTAHSNVYGDLRNLQAAPSQLPAGGMFFVQALGTDQNGNITGGGDIDLVNQADYQGVPSDLGYGQSISLDADGNLFVPVRDPASLLPADRLNTISLSADALSGSGLSEVSLATSGKIDVAQDANVTLNPGGVFNAQAGRAITVDGTISAPSGLISLQTVDVGFGSVFLPDTAQLGSFDIVVNGTLSTRGRWVNDFLVPPDQVLGSAYLNGGSISLYVAPRVALDSDSPTVSDTKKGNTPAQTQDISGSILVNSGSLLDVSGGGYVAPNGSFNLSAKGGNLSLINETTYFQLTDDVNKTPGGIPGFRVTTIDNAGGTAVVPLNPDTINARVTIADGTILANGFAGGGTFTLTTPEFDFGDGPAAAGTLLPMDFFSNAGFANYNITSYKTDLSANTFTNGLGGYNAVLATQTLTVGAGQTGNLAIDASEIDFGSGTLRTYGFGNNVTLAATSGMFVQGVGAFDAGPAELDLQTPFLGDRALMLAPGQDAVLPSLSLTTTGAVNISNPTNAVIPTVAGVPGATLSISGQSVSVTDSELRATAGTLSINSATGINVSGKAIIETPGYSKTLGDSADPVTVSAPGGVLKLTALDGDIDLGTGTTLLVGGGTGKAGTLDLSASNGTVAFNGTLDANAPGGGGSFVLDTGSSFDLSAFDAGAAKEFNGNISIRTGSGDLTLAQGDTLTAANVSLDADGGLVDIAGTINVSGTNGGEVDLFGLSGVTLEGGAHIDAHANGYAATDTRQASGGTVNIGTDGDGEIKVLSGATIDVSAHNTGDRLVPMVQNGVTYYTYVEGDQGGIVNFRAPVIEDAGGDTVNVNYAGTITGARSIVLEGFKKFDLGAIASDPDFTGVSINAQGQAVLDTGASAPGEMNFLADNAPGTLVQFVQDFDVSASYGNLGGLASQANFHARPGMELDYSGDIVLASNWNLGAGRVDVAGAVAAGLMAPVPSLPGQYYVLPGQEGAVFTRFTHLTYRVDGAVDGEPGVLTMRAGGNLDIQGSINDGFFQFRDQTDPGYLSLALGGGDRIYSPTISPICLGGACGNVGQWQAGDALPGSYINIGIPSASSLQGLLENPAPYSAIANSPAALGSLPGGTGDPLGSAQLFPLLNGTQAVDSWSYNLVGGADAASVDPTRTLAGATGNVIVEGTHPYTFAAVKGTSVFDSTLLMRAGTQYVTPDQWYQAFVSQNPSLDPNSFTFLNFASAPANVKTFLTSAAADFFAQYPGQFQLVGPAGAPTGVTTTLAIASKFMSDVVAANFASLQSNYKPPKATAVTKPTTATAPTLVRTGTGNINVAAAGDIDLRNGVDPTYEKITGAPGTPAQGGLQLGGTAIYTAGHLANTTPRTVIDELTGQSFTIDPTAYESSSNIFASTLSSGYQYGAGGAPDIRGDGFTGILLANPVYAEGGGDVSLDAGQDVLGRRDI